MRATACVLHVTAVPFTARKLLLPQMHSLRDAGYEVRLACAPEPGGWGPDLSPFRPVSLAFPRQLKLKPLAQALSKLPDVVREAQPTLLHLHSPAAALPARLLPRRLFPDGLRIVYTVHGFAHQWDQPSVRSTVLAGLEKLLAPRADALLFQSHEDFEHASARRFRTRLRLLGNGVEDAWFELPPPGPDRPMTVLFVGRLVRKKGVLDLLRAVRDVPDLRLLVAGAALDSDRDGVEGEVRRLAATPELRDRVELLGMLTRDELRTAMLRAGALVLPSYREGVPRSVIEALAAGRPALVTNIRGCRELVQDGINGFLVPPGNPEALARGLADLVALDEAAFRSMSDAARRSVDPGRRESQVFRTIAGVYEELGVTP